MARKGRARRRERRGEMLCCVECKEWKHESEFYPRRDRPGQFRTECKACNVSCKARRPPGFVQPKRRMVLGLRYCKRGDHYAPLEEFGAGWYCTKHRAEVNREYYLRIKKRKGESELMGAPAAIL